MQPLRTVFMGLTHGLKASRLLFLLILGSDQLPGVRLHI